MTQILFAPCKINLTLDVFAPRADGYHDLDSIVLPLLPADSVRMDVARSDGDRHTITLTCSDPSLPTDDKNLAYRAAQAFLRHFPVGAPVSVCIALEKHLPHQAGLGGGSSDAAVVLLALAAEIGGVDTEQLKRVAAEIGSDVPLFLAGQPVRMRGRGDQVDKIDWPEPNIYGVLVKPDVGVPTAEAYRLLDAIPRRENIGATPRLLERIARGGTAEGIADALHNDFEAPILSAFPAVRQAHEAVASAGALRALLCGSGAAVFGLARDSHHAANLAERLTGRFPYVAVARPFVPGGALV